jgi:hypothetical protein
MLAVDAEAEMELQPETASFRKALLMRWQALRDTFVESNGAGPELGELRALLSTLLTSAPVAAVVRFVTSNREWRRGDRQILSSFESGAELVQSVYPRPTWSKTPTLTSDIAADDSAWNQWVCDWAAEFSSTGATAALALTPRGGVLAGLLRMKDEAMVDKKAALLAMLSLSQVAVQVCMGADKHRKARVAGEDATPLTLEKVMEAAQCHIPTLKDALAVFMGDDEQSRQCVDVVVGNPDLLAMLNTLSGLRPTMPPPAPSAPSARPPPRAASAAPPPPPPASTQAPTAAQSAPSAPSARPAATPSGWQPSLPEYRPEFRPRSPETAPPVDWASAFLAGRGPPAVAPAGPRAESPIRKLDVSTAPSLEPPVAASAPGRAVTAPAGIIVPQELAGLEKWAQERSHAVRERGDRLAAQLEAFLAATGLSAPELPAPDFADPADTADAIAAATPIQPTHFDPDEQNVDSHVKALIERTKRRLERRYHLDDQFLAWLEERFETVQSAAQAGASTAA